MGEQRASELANALARCDNASAPKSGGHKLATDAAAKLLALGKLRQAEKAYRELVDKHGDRESYVGLAQTQAALEDNEAALTTLREGAAKFARDGDRASAVSLLAAAVTLVPLDLSAHRRLAAALANQGDLPGAVEEYARYVDAALAAADPRRALLEISYGRETLGDLPGLLALVDRISSPGTQAASASAPRVDGPQPAKRRSPLAKVQSPQPTPPAPMKIEQPATKNERPATLDWGPVPSPGSKLAPTPAAKPKDAPNGRPLFARPAPVFTTPEALARTRPDASHTAVVQRDARTLTHAERGDLNAPVDMLARAGIMQKKAPRPAADIEPLLKTLTPTGSGLDAAAMAASRAALLTSARDARATEAVLDAARRLLALGKLSSASDVLLDYIGHGFTEREAQRLLIEIDCALGRRDMAREKCNLLGHAYRLDGRTDVAEDVERLGRIL